MRYKNDRHRMFTILCYLYHYPGDEGIGGIRADLHNGHWRAGTRLRAPWGPLWGMNKSKRLSYLNKLVETDCLLTDGSDYVVTEYGLSLLKRYPYRLVDYVTWYKHMGTGKMSRSSRYAYCDPNKIISLVQAILPGSNYGISISKIYDL